MPRRGRDFQLLPEATREAQKRLSPGPEEIVPGSPQKERTLPTPEAARGREVPARGWERDQGPAHLDLDFWTPALSGAFLSFCTVQYLVKRPWQVKPAPLTVKGLKTLILGLWG